MRTPPANPHAQIVALRQLHGRELPIHKRIADTCDGVDRLQTATRSWRSFAPRAAALDQAIQQADACARALRELREALTREVPPDAA